MEHLEWLLSLVANTAIIIFEFIGVGIIIYSGLTSFLKFLRRSPDTKIYLAKGLAMGLEFKMGSEILRTVVVREWKMCIRDSLFPFFLSVPKAGHRYTSCSLRLTDTA